VAWLALGAGIALGACSSGSEPVADPTVVASAAAPELFLTGLEPAIEAVAAELGGSSRYTEINVQPELINLFVALDDGTELAYVYRDAGLEPPPEPTPQPEGAVPFALDDVPLDAVDAIPDTLADELPESMLVRLSLLAAPGGGVQWTASMIGSKGTPFDVVLSPAGAIVGVLPG
jgi:hypothetical protein